MIYKTFLLFLSLIVLISCSSANSVDEWEDPFIVGFITHVESDNLRLLIEENVNVEEPLSYNGNKIWLSLNSKTKLFRENENGRLEHCNTDCLTGGYPKARAWVTGAIAESYPLQGTASRIVFLNH